MADVEVSEEVPPPSPLPRTKWTRRVPHPVIIGHAASVPAAHGGERDRPQAIHEGVDVARDAPPRVRDAARSGRAEPRRARALHRRLRPDVDLHHSRARLPALDRDVQRGQRGALARARALCPLRRSARAALLHLSTLAGRARAQAACRARGAGAEAQEGVSEGPRWLCARVRARAGRCSHCIDARLHRAHSGETREAREGRATSDGSPS